MSVYEEETSDFDISCIRPISDHRLTIVKPPLPTVRACWRQAWFDTFITNQVLIILRHSICVDAGYESASLIIQRLVQTLLMTFINDTDGADKSRIDRAMVGKLQRRRSRIGRLP